MPRGGISTGRYFGTDGFRGRAGSQLTAEHAFRTGAFLGAYYSSLNGTKCRAVIGKDTRRSSYMLEYALVAGLTSSGADAYLMHVTTTPSVSFAARCGMFDCGIVISASHNPYYDNGIKLLNSKGEKLGDEVINLLENYLDDPSSYPVSRADGVAVGAAVDYVAGRNNYIAHLMTLVSLPLSGMKIGLDCANGAAYNIAGRVFRSLGAEVHCVGCRPDGFNVNDKVGSTHISKLRTLVKDRGLDIGFAFDGDGDRCICVDENGSVIDGDGILYILARFLSDENALSGNKIVATVMSNSGLVRSLGEQGIAVERCAVGDRFVYEKMCRCGAVLGGEQSGHIIVGKVENTGDGIVTALYVAQAMKSWGVRASAMTDGLAVFPQVCASVAVSDKMSAFSPEVDREKLRAEALLGGSGRVLVRPSGTEDVVRIMVEGEDENLCVRLCDRLVSAIRGGEECAE